MAQTVTDIRSRTAERSRCKASKADMDAMLADYRAEEAKRRAKGYKYVCSHCGVSHVPEVTHGNA